MFKLLFERSLFFNFGTAVLAVLLILFALKKRSQKSKKIYPPGPTPHWLFGNATQLPESCGEHVDVTLLEWCKIYGKIFSFTVPFLPRVIVVSDPDFARHILVTKNYQKSPTYKQIVPVIGEKSIIKAEGSEWSKQRRAFNPGFSPDFLRNVVNVILIKASRLLDKCEAEARLGIASHTHSLATDFTSDVIAEVAFGEDWGFDMGGKATNETQIFLTDLIQRMAIIDSKPLMKLFGGKERERLSNELDKSMRRVVERRIAFEKDKTDTSNENGPQKEKSRDILSLALQHLTNENEGKHLSDEDLGAVADQLKSFYFAGHDTTSILIAWTMWLVAQHPRVADKIRKEVTAELGKYALQRSSAREPKGKGGELDKEVHTMTYERLKRCTYLEATLQETLRLYPPASSARWADDPNAKYGGYNYGRCILYINVYLLHRHPDLWDRPDEFYPERFLDDDGNKKNYEYTYMPFMKGNRDCIGKYFAMLEAKIAVATLLFNFDVEVIDPNEKITKRITAQPMNGAKVKFTIRKQ